MSRFETKQHDFMKIIGSSMKTNPSVVAKIFSIMLDKRYHTPVDLGVRAEHDGRVINRMLQVAMKRGIVFRTLSGKVKNKWKYKLVREWEL